MMSRAMVGLGVILAALFLAGCTSSETFRYRMIVEVETPEGLRTGLSVREVEIWERVGESMIGNKVGGKVRGEAVAVDLPNGKTLYMLLGDARWHAHRAIKTPPPGKGHHDWGVKRARWMIDNKAKGELPREKYPMLVTFEDESDPTSVMEVDRDDLEATFGEGYRLKRVRIEITNDRVTTGIRSRLPQPDDKGFFNWDGNGNPNERSVVGIWDFSLRTKNEPERFALLARACCLLPRLR